MLSSIIGVVTQGQHKGSEKYMKSFTMQHSLDGSSWFDVLHNEIKVFYYCRKLVKLGFIVLKFSLTFQY